MNDMRLKYLFIFYIGFLFSVQTIVGRTIPEIIDVGIFTGESITRFNFTVTHGRYLVCNNNHEKLLEITPFSTITFERNGSEFNIIRNDSVLYTEGDIKLQGAAFHNSFILNPSNRDLDLRGYDGDLKVEVKNRKFLLVNSVPFESYVAGTVQWESGFNHHDNFYQVQAIIIRTYALRNLERHSHEGFHLCDKVHCQAYYGKSTEASIIAAVNRCRGEVAVDLSGNLLNTVYHANCGGETVNSEDLWSEPLPYLRSEKDNFCTDMPGARWQTTIRVQDLRNFLQQRFLYNPTGNEWEGIAGFRQSSRKHYLDPGERVQLRHIREHFGLRSTYFTIQPDGENLILKGKGYGHGVGLCQEGAMQRARHGHSREEILKFYYRNSSIHYLETEEVW
jgi:stage II sporulation protein D